MHTGVYEARKRKKHSLNIIDEQLRARFVVYESGRGDKKRVYHVGNATLEFSDMNSYFKVKITSQSPQEIYGFEEDLIVMEGLEKLVRIAMIERTLETIPERT